MFKKKSLIIVLLITAVFMFSSCSKEKDPVQVFNEFSDAWMKKDFSSMYSMMDSSTKSKLTEEDFIANNEAFFENAYVDNLEISTDITYEEIEDELKDKIEAIMPFEIKVSTSYGDFSMYSNAKIVKEKEDKENKWNIVWNNTYFLSDYTDEEVSISTKILSPTRGSIYDRNDALLAGYGDVIRVAIVPGRFNNNKDVVIKDLATEFNLTEEFIQSKLDQSWVKDDSLVVLLNIPVSQISRIKTINEKYINDDGKSPATYDTIEGRVYPLGESAAHLTGYIGMITAEELEKHKDKGYTSTDYIGKTGMEALYEEELHGQSGIAISLKVGDNSTDLLKKEAINGEDLKLTIDSTMQQSLFNQLEKDSGTASVMNHKTGEIMALVSSPSYDPNKFVLGISSEEYNELTNNPYLPMVNKFSKVYAPGSTFKALTGAIALETGVVDENFSINVDGVDWQADPSWGNYFVTRVSSNANVDMEKAYIYSDNIYFAQLSLKIGQQNFVDYSKKFGIGDSLNIGYSIDSSQLISDPNTTIKETLLADTGYGQGEVEVNPLYLSKAYTAFMNEGQVIEPILLYNDVATNKEAATTAISPDVANKIYSFLLKIVEDPNGTANAAKIAGREIAGKTGTAELKASKDDANGTENGWFIALENSDEKPYITTMMIEEVQNRGGSHYVVGKVKSFLESY
ncbi:penicillin-binding transpeptidase domain-containing protein [Clostridium sp. DL1XJH146]